MNTMRSATSIIGSSGRLAALGATLALAACGTSQNWEDGSAYVTIGGTVSGLSGGTLALWNNGQDKLAVPGNGSFKFSLSIANGSSYQVLVATQPDGQTCTVANGSGKATNHVTNVAVTCQPYKFTLRPLPAIYRTGKAVNYSPYRADGPAAGEQPSDADIKQDLTLLNTAGFNLVRLFGVRAPGDPTIPNRILTIAEQNFPNMKFQLGIELKGLTSCSDTSNDATIAYSIGTLAKHANVVTVSVGNETSFFSKFMPLSCLTSYIRTVRSQVSQPVTADDDFTFYAGLTGEFGDRVAVKPDAVLAMIDFVSIHLYPISNPTWWNWQQLGVPPGPGRAKAMMEASLAVAKDWYQQVAAYQYANADGITVTIGNSLPITVGETGWKALQTTPASGIELFAALQPNQKWYYDLLYGTGGGYASWQGASGGPVTIFWFEATDEAWKGIDDGWGLWDAKRNARYALCGTPAGPACKSDLYSGAGFYNAPFANITFDSSSATYSFAGFGGAEDAQVVTDPAGAPNRVARVNRSAGAQVWAGTTVSTQPGNTAGVIPFTSSNTRMTVRVYSPAAGIPVRLKVEDAANGARSVETQVNTTVANAWETLTFNFASPVPGTPALNLTYLYDRVSIFFNFGTDGATAGAQTYYFDDVTFVTGATTLSFASKYWQIDGANWQTVEGGAAGNYIDGSVPTQYWWNGVGSNPSNFYFGYGINVSAKPWGFGAYSRAPGNGTVNLSGYTNLQITVWGNDELMATRPTLTIILKGPTIGGCSTTLMRTVSVPGTGPQTYTLPLSGFTLQTPCTGVTTAAKALTSVAEVHVQVLGPALQYSAGGDTKGNYPNGLNYGPISFN